MPVRSPTLLAVLLAVFVGGWLAVRLLGGGGESLRVATDLPKPREIAEFSLLDENGEVFRRENLRGHWSLMFMGYTHCPDVCPNTLALLKSVKAQLAARRPDAELSTVFLSVDPERDNPVSLARYVNYFDPAFVGVTGEKSQIDRLGESLGLYYAIKRDGTSYQVDHTAAVVVIDPAARVRAYFVSPGNAAAMADDLRVLMDGAST